MQSNGFTHVAKDMLLVWSTSDTKRFIRIRILIPIINKRLMSLAFGAPKQAGKMQPAAWHDQWVFHQEIIIIEPASSNTSMFIVHGGVEKKTGGRRRKL